MRVSWANLDAPGKHAIRSNVDCSALGEDDCDVPESAPFADNQAIATAPFRGNAPLEASALLDDDFVVFGRDGDGGAFQDRGTFDDDAVVLADDLDL